MTVHIFVICIAVGAAAVAMWVNFRFPNLMPWKMGRLLVHLVLALLCVYVVSPGMATVMSLGIPAAKIAAVFVVAFPALADQARPGDRRRLPGLKAARHARSRRAF